MGVWLQIVTLLAVTTASLASEQECDDACLCPTSTAMTCDGRELTQLPSGQWVDISNVDLSHNHIVLNKDSFATFPNVAVLKMRSNGLAELDLETFAEMRYLETLDLQDNAIKKIVSPTEGVVLESLSYLFLNNNSISELDPDVLQSAAPNLKYLFLNNNKLVVPEGKPVLNHLQLVLLHVQYGSTLHLGPESLTGLPKLREVAFTSADITSITGAFVTNDGLDVLGLVHNNIIEITTESFPASAWLLGLWLDGNPLQRLSVSAVEGAMRSGGRIGIDDTPLACACGFEELHRWAQAHGVTLFARCGGVSLCAFDAQA